MSATLNGSSTLERFERSNMIEICDGIMFDFYPGLPHIYEPKYVHVQGLAVLTPLEFSG